MERCCETCLSFSDCHQRRLGWCLHLRRTVRKGDVCESHRQKAEGTWQQQMAPIDITPKT